MEFNELKKKKEKDLHILLAESRDKLRDLRFKDANKQLKDVREIRKLRLIIQRILTILNMKKEKENLSEGGELKSGSGDQGQKEKVLAEEEKK